MWNILSVLVEWLRQLNIYQSYTTMQEYFPVYDQCWLTTVNTILLVSLSLRSTVSWLARSFVNLWTSRLHAVNITVVPQPLGNTFTNIYQGDACALPSIYSHGLGARVRVMATVRARVTVRMMFRAKVRARTRVRVRVKARANPNPNPNSNRR